MLHDLYNIRILHHKLTELAAYPNPSLVVEAQYADFSDPKRIGEGASAGHLLWLLGELSALHPGLQITFAGNRKFAEAWTLRFFTAVQKASRERSGSASLSESAERPPEYVEAPVNPELELRDRILNDFGKRPDGFRMKDIREPFPELKDTALRRLLRRLQEEGLLARLGKGSETRYMLRGNCS